MMAAWSLAVSRALELANSPSPHLPHWHKAWVIHLLFAAYPLAAIIGVLIGAIHINALYNHLLHTAKATIASLYATDARSATFTPSQYAGALDAEKAQVAASGAAFIRFFNAFKLSFYFSLGYDLLSWAVCSLVSLPYLVRMSRALWRRRGLPALPRGRRVELRVAFVSAAATVGFLASASLAYAILVIIAIVDQGGDVGFVKLADTRQVSAARVGFKAGPTTNG